MRNHPPPRPAPLASSVAVVCKYDCVLLALADTPHIWAPPCRVRLTSLVEACCPGRRFGKGFIVRITLTASPLDRHYVVQAYITSLGYLRGSCLFSVCSSPLAGDPSPMHVLSLCSQSTLGLFLIRQVGRDQRRLFGRHVTLLSRSLVLCMGHLAFHPNCLLGGANMFRR